MIAYMIIYENREYNNQYYTDSNNDCPHIFTSKEKAEEYINNHYKELAQGNAERENLLRTHFALSIETVIID